MHCNLRVSNIGRPPPKRFQHAAPTPPTVHRIRTMEMNALLAAELTIFSAFAVYLVFAQLAHMKKLKERDRAEAASADRPASEKEPRSS
jgi:hypothetical protein